MGALSLFNWLGGKLTSLCCGADVFVTLPTLSEGFWVGGICTLGPSLGFELLDSELDFAVGGVKLLGVETLCLLPLLGAELGVPGCDPPA